MKFKYNGRIYNPVNIEKKLKKMGITMEDIEILPNEKKENSNDELEDYMLDKEQVIVCSIQDNIRRVCYVKRGTRPPFKKLFEKEKWNPIFKTGIKEFTDEYFKTMYYL